MRIVLAARPVVDHKEQKSSHKFGFLVNHRLVDTARRRLETAFSAIKAGLLKSQPLRSFLILNMC